jgi:hypothetical protein
MSQLSERLSLNEEKAVNAFVQQLQSRFDQDVAECLKPNACSPFGHFTRCAILWNARTWLGISFSLLRRRPAAPIISSLTR